MTKFGKYNEDGTTTEADECILTGSYVDFANSVRERVKGTPYFYRVIGHQYENVTPEFRAKWAKEAKADDKPAPISTAKAPKASEVKE